MLRKNPPALRATSFQKGEKFFPLFCSPFLKGDVEDRGILEGGSLAMGDFLSFWAIAKNLVYHLRSFTSFRMTRNIKNTCFFIFISGLKQVKLPLNSILKSQNFIHNLLVFHHSNLFSPLVILIARRLFQVHFE